MASDCEIACARTMRTFRETLGRQTVESARENLLPSKHRAQIQNFQKHQFLNRKTRPTRHASNPYKCPKPQTCTCAALDGLQKHSLVE
eukprot:5596498-Pyramimonas_sp.AAC.1